MLLPSRLQRRVPQAPYTGLRSWPCIALHLLMLVGGVGTTCAQPARFVIWKGADQVGSLMVDRNYQGDRTLYTMTSFSKLDVALWTQVVSTVMTAEYVGDQLEACASTVHLNGAMRDSSSMRTSAGVAQGYVHPGHVLQGGNGNAWTTARMYYEEPVGQESIYVESVLSDCPLQRLPNGIYRLVLPDDKVNRYVYRDGVLQEVHVDRTFFDLVFRRV